MTRPRIALLNASFDDANTLRNFRRELAADLEVFDASDGHLPDTFDYDALVVTGSRASVYWDEEWIHDARSYVGEAVDRGLPVFGVCWGHQLLAEALGGEVGSMGEYELGYREVEVTDDESEGDLFRGIDSTFTAFMSHSDEVVETPPDADILAENDYSIQAFRAGSAVGVQFHPEYDQRTARQVTRRKDLPEERIESVLEDITDEAYAAACETKTLFDNFLREVPVERAAD